MGPNSDPTGDITNSEEFFREVQQIAAIGGWEFDRQTETVRWTDELYRIHGLEADAVESIDDALSFYHPEDRGRIVDALERLLVDEDSYVLEARIIRPDDETRWVRTHGEPWYDGGELRGAHGSLQDITADKEQKQELELFRAAVEQAGHGVVITDSEGKIEYANPAYVRDTGYELDELRGRTPRVSRSGKHDDEFYAEMWETILSGEVWQTEQLINRRKSGELYHVDQTIAPIRADNGEITHFVAIESEVTDLRLREQRLDVLNRILRHNVRNSMNVIQGYLSVLEATAVEDQQETIETISDRIERLVSISDKVSALRSLFDGTTGDTACAVDELVETVTEEFNTRYPAVTVTTTVPDSEISARCDDRIRIAISEAIENAIVHNDDADPAVSVSVLPPDDAMPWVTVRIVDNGPGIPTQDRKAIEIGEETAITHASSIGLWIIYWTVKTFGGEVSIRDNEPTGSIVEMTFPASDRPQER